MIDITGLSKAAVLAALHNGTRPLGMGFLQAMNRGGGGQSSSQKQQSGLSVEPTLITAQVDPSK